MLVIYMRCLAEWFSKYLEKTWPWPLTVDPQMVQRQMQIRKSKAHIELPIWWRKLCLPFLSPFVGYLQSLFMTVTFNCARTCENMQIKSEYRTSYLIAIWMCHVCHHLQYIYICSRNARAPSRHWLCKWTKVRYKYENRKRILDIQFVGLSVGMYEIYANRK